MKRKILIGLLTRDEVARLTKLSKHTIARKVKAGLLRERRFNRRLLRYAPDDVADFLAAKGEPSDIHQSHLSTSVPVATSENLVLNLPNNNDTPQKPGYEATETGVLEAQNPKNIGKSKKNPQKQAPGHIMGYETRSAENPVFQGFEELSSVSWPVLNRFGNPNFSYLRNLTFGGRFHEFGRLSCTAAALN